MLVSLERVKGASKEFYGIILPAPLIICVY